MRFANVPDPILPMVRADKITDTEQRWIVPEFLPDCTLSVLAGMPGVGKSTAALSIASSISRGEVPVIGGSRETGLTILLTNEDSPAHIRRTFERLDGDLTKLLIEDDERLPWSLDDCEILERTVKDLKPALVIVDSYFSHAGKKTDTNRHAEVTPALLQLRCIAEASSCGVLVVHHANKNVSNQPLSRIAGSVGIIAAARHVLFVGEHPDDESQRVVGVAKSNLGHANAESQVFELDPFRWIGQSEVRATDLLQPATPVLPDMIEKASAFLCRLLSSGSKNSSDLQKQACAEGISWASVRRAQAQLGIRPRKATMTGGWMWELPEGSREDAPR